MSRLYLAMALAIVGGALLCTAMAISTPNGRYLVDRNINDTESAIVK